MSKLWEKLTIGQLKENNSLLVPAIFTHRQLELLQNKLQHKKLSNNEEAYFSRTVSKKLNAISSLIGMDKRYYLSGESEMLPERKKEALKILRKTERNHKGIKIILAGSFLYNKKYNDIDVFLITNYDKEDYWKDGIHYNYLPSDSLGTLFFDSISKISIANFDLNSIKVKEQPNINNLISKYQEVMQDINQKNTSWLKIDLRDLILECSYAEGKVVLNSKQLKHKLELILNHKKKTEVIQRMFVSAITNNFPSTKVKKISTNLIKSYKELMKEYRHKDYYGTLISSFQEVLNLAS
jgi:hypothetical protein